MEKAQGQFEGSDGKLSKNALVSNFASKVLQPREIFGPKYVIKGLPTI